MLKAHSATPSACLTQNYSLEIIEFYLSHNVDATIKDPDGNNLLHCLARKDPYEYNIIKYTNRCFSNCCSIITNALNNNGKTPIDRDKKTQRKLPKF
jgi:ankyrin repeat protein